MARKNESDDENINDQSNAEASEVLTVEEHAAKTGVKAPVLAAVKQVQRWADGKKVSLAVFNDAVHSFLGSPMGGI